MNLTELEIRFNITLSIFSGSHPTINSSIEVSNIIFIFFSSTYGTVDNVIFSIKLIISIFLIFICIAPVSNLEISIRLFTNLNNLNAF